MSIGSLSGGNPPDNNEEKQGNSIPKEPKPQDSPGTPSVSRPSKSRLGRRYGWKPQLPDARDRHFYSARKLGSMPVYKNLHSLCKTVFDQGQEGSCTANAAVQAMMMTMTIERHAQVTLSRNFLYFNTRLIEADTQFDNGAYPRDAMQSAATTGIVTEDLWPYGPKTLFTQPDASLYSVSGKHRIQEYLAVAQSLTQMQQCLADGYPFTVGFSVYDSFESNEVANSGNVPMPNLETESLLGGHDVVVIGYNNGPDQHFTDGRVWPKNTFLCQNSWGEWGMVAMAGCFSIPYDYLTNPSLASDNWTIRLDT